MDSIDKNLRRLRISRNMKQEELAQRMHVSRQTVSGWETGRRQPDLETLKKLAEVLEADIQELIYGDKPGEYPKYQKRYVTQTVLFGGIILMLVLFRILIFPYFRKICAIYYWGTAWFICCEVLPMIGAFALGALIPPSIRLLAPMRMEKKKARWLVLGGAAALFPALLFWLGVLPLNTWFLYTVGHPCITYVLPFVSGVCVMLGLAGERAWDSFDL